MHRTFKDIPPSMIEPNKFNPNVMSSEQREALRNDMKMSGPTHDLSIDRVVVSPKNVFYNNSEFDNEHFVIIDGQHRWELSIELKWATLPCEIRCLSEQMARWMCYRKNKERGNIDPIKEALLFQSEIDKGFTQDRIARGYNVTRSHVANRLSLLKLAPKTVEIFRNPEKEFKKKQLEEFDEEHKEWEVYMEERTEPGQIVHRVEPKVEEVNIVPHGTLSTSHLEAMSSLPESEQIEVAQTVLAQDLTVRGTERLVRRAKEELARKKLLEDTLKKAKRKKCPSCGGDPKKVTENGRFRCGVNKESYSYCYNTWDPMISQKEADKQREEQMSQREKNESQNRTDRFKEARENPSYIRMLENSVELEKLVEPWLMRKILQLTEVNTVSIRGKRGKEEVTIDYNPGSMHWRNLSLGLTIKPEKGESVYFGFWVEDKAYKKFDAKSRVNISNMMDTNEESRELIRKFFSSIVKTDQDPMEAKKN